ncbi:DNA-binding transcriptional regulator, LysR family [Paracoccus alcaliphilus]|uniref:DNA-binding transcriptional regulator, LysR family n=1 Tax=Paracoccus alcaliphilus TaxID=34002 RepID=A0A1H8MMP1_9RHOB|nr:LysR family transcriptional regulator [Paracoccus alcaliphilus]WCR21099.1 LysR family transcriptional regulator [Paracoccus alcaliphilus]SEO18518.1 DNA-binding transcriptional regulator, LysR family [Paracoccus alcaliphilus]
MRLEWIEDILAVADTGSMIRAAERRFLTQSAFSRRLRTIEEQLGVELFDRSRKPAELRRAVLEHCEEMRKIADSLRKLRSDLVRGNGGEHTRIVIASQHAITAAIAPILIQAITEPGHIDIRLRSANRENCYTLLLTRQADFMLSYSTDRQPLIFDPDFIETCVLGREQLIPVFSSQDAERLNAAWERRQVPVVLYPNDVFLGKVVRDEIWPRFTADLFRPYAETALTLAALQFALIGAALVWVPRSLAQPYILKGELEELSNTYGTAELTLSLSRINGSRSPHAEATWTMLISCGQTQLSAILD